MANSSFWIGNQTAFFAPPLIPFNFAVDQGFDAFEFFPDGGPKAQGWSAADIGPNTRTFVRATAFEHDMRLSVHTTLSADLRSPAGREALFHDLTLAHEIGAHVLNTHFELRDPEQVARDLQGMAGVLDEAGLVLALENTVEASPEDFNNLFARLPRGPFAMCLDIGHANLHRSTRNDYLGYMDRLSQRIPIAHIHAHENRGDVDSHLPLFTGPAQQDSSGLQGLVTRLHQRDFSGSVIMEQWPAPPSLLVVARQRLRALIERSVAASREGT
jgi:sugar phosphate isomerase/epimerase